MLSSLKQKYINPLIVSDYELVQACEDGNLPLLQEYITEYNINGIDAQGIYVPLLLACEQDQTQVVRFLLSFPNLDVNKLPPAIPVSGSQRLSALCIAIVNNNMDIIHLLMMDSRTSYDFNDKLSCGSPLFLACDLNLYDITKLLLPVSNPNPYYMSQPILVKYYNNKQYQIVKLLLSSPKIKLNDHHDMERVLRFVQIVVEDKNYDIIKYMLQQPHIDINGFYFKSEVLLNPNRSWLHEVYITGMKQLVEMCFDYDKLDINLDDGKDKQAIYYAIDHSDILSFLLSRSDLKIYDPHSCLASAFVSDNYISFLLLIADSRFGLHDDISKPGWKDQSNINILAKSFWNDPVTARQHAMRKLQSLKHQVMKKHKDKNNSNLCCSEIKII